MADKNSSELIPKGWEFETKTKKDGSQVSHYICRKTGQRFYTYEDMMRYVNYAKEAGLPVYLPNFDFRKKKKASQSSDSAPDEIEESWDSEKGTDIEKSLDSEKDSDIEKSLDSEKLDDAGELVFPKNDPIEKISPPVADVVPSKDGVMAEQEPRQTSSDQAPVVESPHPRIRASLLPKSSRSMKRTGCAAEG